MNRDLVQNCCVVVSTVGGPVPLPRLVRESGAMWRMVTR